MTAMVAMAAMTAMVAMVAAALTVVAPCVVEDTEPVASADEFPQLLSLLAITPIYGDYLQFLQLKTILNIYQIT